MILSSHGIIGSSIGQVDADYQAVLDYATTQGYTLPSASQRLLQEQLVIDLKDAGIWSKLDTFAVFATDGDEDFALIDWKRLTQYTGVNSPTFIINEGFQGNGTSSYINTNFNAAVNGVNYTLNDASRYIYMQSVVTERRLDGDVIGVNNSMFGQNSVGQRINGGALLLSSVDLTGTGIKCIHRVSATDIVLFNNTTRSDRTSTSSSIVSTNQFALRTVSNYNDGTASMYAMGASLVSENTDFVNAFNTYISSL
jgi:hypothetical protein